MMKIKTASGITRFQENKGYGNWFNNLCSIVKTMEHCQPEQAIEPSMYNADSSLSTENDEGESSVNVGADTSASTSSGKRFVPIHETNNKRKKSELLEVSIKKLVDILENDPSKELLNVLKRDSERQARKIDSLWI